MKKEMTRREEIEQAIDDELMEEGDHEKNNIRLRLPRDISPKELSNLEKTLKGAGAQSFKIWYVDRDTAEQNMGVFKDYLPGQKEKPQIVMDNHIRLKLPSGLSKNEFEDLTNELYKAGARYDKITIPAEKSYTGHEVTVWNWYINPDRVDSLVPFQPYMENKTIKFRLPENLTKEEAEKIGKELLDAGAYYQNYAVPANKSRDGKEHKGRNWFVNPAKVPSMDPFKDFIGMKQALSNKENGMEAKENSRKETTIAPTSQTQQKAVTEKTRDDGAR